MVNGCFRGFIFFEENKKKASKLLNVFKPLPQILENISVKDKKLFVNLSVKRLLKWQISLMGNNGRVE